jgi:hypothetical protein
MCQVLTVKSDREIRIMEVNCEILQDCLSGFLWFSECWVACLRYINDYITRIGAERRNEVFNSLTWLATGLRDLYMGLSGVIAITQLLANLSSSCVTHLPKSKY